MLHMCARAHVHVCVCVCMHTCIRVRICVHMRLPVRSARAERAERAVFAVCATHTMGRACCASACMLSIRDTNGTLEIAQLLLELGDRWRECMFDYLMFEASLLTSVVVIVVVRVQASR